MEDQARCYKRDRRLKDACGGNEGLSREVLMVYHDC